MMMMGVGPTNEAHKFYIENYTTYYLHIHKRVHIQAGGKILETSCKFDELPGETRCQRLEVGNVMPHVGVFVVCVCVYPLGLTTHSSS